MIIEAMHGASILEFQQLFSINISAYGRIHLPWGSGPSAAPSWPVWSTSSYVGAWYADPSRVRCLRRHWCRCRCWIRQVGDKCSILNYK